MTVTQIKNLDQLLNIEGNNPFNHLLIKMQLSKAVLSKDSKINKGPV